MAIGNKIIITVIRQIQERSDELGNISTLAEAAVLLMKQNSEIFFINDFGERLFGFKSKDLVGKNFFTALFTNEQYKNFQKRFQEISVIGKDTMNKNRVVLTAKSRTGRKIPIVMNIYLADAESFTSSDLLLAHKQADQLQDSYQDLAQNAPIGILSCDTEGNITYANPFILVILGVTSADDAKKLNILQFEPIKEAGVSNFFEKCLTSGEVIVKELPFTSIWGIESELYFHIIPTFDENRKLTGVWSIIEDITDRIEDRNKLIEAKNIAEAASRAKSDFLANMSHEIRTPMNGILGMLDLMAKTNLNAEQEDYLQTVKKSAENLLTIINDILDISKIEAGKLQTEESEFCLTEIVQEVYSILSAKAQEKKIDLIVEISPGLPENIIGDQVRIKQIITNLAGNAIKFTEKGEVKISVSVKKSLSSQIQIQFRVSDTGIGIPLEDQSKLFQAFTQVDTSTTRKYGGTGLGLAIVKKLCDLFNGSIELESTPGKGTVFTATVTLKKAKPRKQPVQVESNDKKIEQTTKAAQDIAILVAEDNAINQKLMVRILELNGYHCDLADNGELAAKAVKNKKYDIVFMDIQMPVMSGFEATETIRKAEKKKKRLPIIALTANALVGDKEKCLEAGMDDYLSKPVKAAEIVEKIRKWVK